MNKLALTLVLMMVSMQLFAFIEYGFGMGYAINNNSYNEYSHTSLDESELILDFDLRQGIQLKQSPFYLIYDLQAGYSKAGQRFDFYSLQYTNWEFAITPGFMFKPNNKARLSATFGLTGSENFFIYENKYNHWNYKNTYHYSYKAYTLNLHGDIDLSKKNVILLLGTNFTHLSLIDKKEDYYVYYDYTIINDMFEYSLRAGMKLITTPQVYLFGVLNQSLTTYREWDYYDNFKSKSNVVYFAPELVYFPTPPMQISASVGFVHASFDRGFHHAWGMRPNKEKGRIFEVSVELDIDNHLSGVICGLKYLNSSDYAIKHESLFYDGIFLYLRWENRSKRENNRITYLSTRLPSNGSIFK